MKQIVGLITAVILTFGSITAFSETNDTGNFNCNAGENLYTDKLSDVDAPVPYADYGGELLTGTVKEIYEQLKSYSREIACGERTVTDNLLIECSNAISEDDINTLQRTLCGSTRPNFCIGASRTGGMAQTHQRLLTEKKSHSKSM